MSNLAQQKEHQLIRVAGTFILGICLLVNVYMVWRNISLHRDTSNKAVRLQQLEFAVREWQMLFQELSAYSARQPAIDPILQKYGLKSSSVSSKPR